MTHRRSRVRRRRARAVLPAADDLCDTPRRRVWMSGRRMPSSPASPARERACCSMPGSTIRFARTLLDALDVRNRWQRSAGTHPRRSDARRSPTLRGDADDGAQVSRMRRRAEQHVDHLRRPADPETVPPPAAGINPDFEIGRAAHREGAASRRVPARGRRVRVRAAWRSRQPRSAMVQQLVPSQGDGWTHALRTRFGRFYDEIERRAAPDGLPDGVGTPNSCATAPPEASPR